MRLAQVITLIWIIACGIVIILIVRNPTPPPPPNCVVCNLRSIFGIASILLGVGGLITPAIVRNHGLSSPR